MSPNLPFLVKEIVMYILESVDASNVKQPPPPQLLTGRRALPPPAGGGRGRGKGRHGSASRDNAPPQMAAAWESQLMEVVMRSLRANGRVISYCAHTLAAPCDPIPQSQRSGDNISCKHIVSYRDPIPQS